MELTNQSACALASSLQSGDLSASELMAATYDRVEIWNPHVNAIISLLDREEALELAQVADKSPSRGPLHGIPLAIKDLANAEKFVTSEGSPLFADSQPALRDDLIVARMRQAGALIIGKTNTPEFGLGSHTVNPVHGATRNPWDLSRSAGGSSGGAAVALATGMLALADGSDMMGSLRNPAGWSGTYGLRPTWGAVPSEATGDTFLSQLSTRGPMARNPDDLELLLSVIAGPDSRQPHGIELPLATNTGRLRIAWLADWNGSYPMETGILDCCQKALEVISTLGHSVELCTPGISTDALWESWTTLRSWQIAAELIQFDQDKGQRDKLGVSAKWELDRGKALSAMEVHDASVIRSTWFSLAAQLFERFDVLALPTAQCWPFDVNLDWPREIAGHSMDTYHRWMEVVIPASLIGLPALGVPAGFGDNGLPIGLQLIGRRKSDYDLLELARRFHKRAPWAGIQPTTESIVPETNSPRA